MATNGAEPQLSSISFNFKCFYFMCMFCLHVCMCIICMPFAHRGQKRASGTLELELQMVESYYVGAGKWKLTCALEEKPALLTAEPFFSPLCPILTATNGAQPLLTSFILTATNGVESPKSFS